MKTTLKKSFLFVALFAAIAMIFTGCNKEKENTPVQPTPMTGDIYYYVTNQLDDYNHHADECFHFNFSYKDADGNMVSVNDAELPWTKKITVTAPFEARIDGAITYDEAEIPDSVYFVKGCKISIFENDHVDVQATHTTKEQLLNLFNNVPETLILSKTFNYTGQWGN